MTSRSTPNTGITTAKSAGSRPPRSVQGPRVGPLLQQFQRVEADIGGRDQADVFVHDMNDLMRGDGRQLVVVQSVDQAAREDENGVLLPNAASECVERRTVDDADIRGRQPRRDRQRLDDTAQARLVLVVDEAEIRPAANGADMPSHLHREQDDAGDGDDRHPTDEVSCPPVERRMVGIEHRERQEERQHGEQMKRGDEPREQRDRTRVVAADVSVEPVHPHGAASTVRSELEGERLVDQHALDPEIERQPHVHLRQAANISCRGTGAALSHILRPPDCRSGARR